MGLHTYFVPWKCPCGFEVVPLPQKVHVNEGSPHDPDLSPHGIRASTCLVLLVYVLYLSLNEFCTLTEQPFCRKIYVDIKERRARWLVNELDCKVSEPAPIYLA